MKPNRPSVTAHRVAMRRAAHQLLDQPLVLDDPIALAIVGPTAVESIRANPRRYQSGFGRALRAFLVARSRCAEDALAAAVARGVSQYVVLGAGLDTFAYRNPHPPDSLHVFEVDFPSTQKWKRKLLADAGVAPPRSLTFVPVDFEQDSLPERLQACGFDPARPAFFSWLGVTMYLNRETIFTTLAFVAGRPKGSGVTFDYLVPPGAMPFLQRIGFHLMARRLAAAGEPWKTWFSPSELERELRGLGFADLEDLDSAALNVRYFGGREKRLGGRSVGRVVTAFR